MKVFSCEYYASLRLLDKVEYPEFHAEATCRYLRISEHGRISFSRLTNRSFGKPGYYADWIVSEDDYDHERTEHFQREEMFRYIIENEETFDSNFIVVLYIYKVDNTIMSDICFIDMTVDDLKNELFEIRLKI